MLNDYIHGIENLECIHNDRTAHLRKLKLMFSRVNPINYKRHRVSVLMNDLSLPNIKPDLFKSTWLELIDILYRNHDLELPDNISNLFISDAINFANRPKVSRFHDLISASWNVKDIVAESLRLASENIEGWAASHTSFSHWVELRSKSAPFMGAITHNGRFIAVWALVLITEDEITKIRKGKISEDQIFGQEYYGPSDYYGYISSIVVDHRIRTSTISHLLLKDFCIQFLKYFKEGVMFKSLIAEAWSQPGRSLCEKLGFIELQRKGQDHALYQTDGENLINNRLFRRLSRIE